MTENLFQPPRNQEILTVSALNRRVAGLLERQLPLIWVRGEVSNFTAAASGHWYFSLKDAHAQIRVVMFRNRAALAGFTPRNGEQIELCARGTLYEPRGEFQLSAETLRRAGAGDLLAQFEATKLALERDGLLDPQRKRRIPSFVKAIGIVTSQNAAALRDALTTLRLRAPGVSVFLFPALVQGRDAPLSLMSAVQRAEQHSALFDVLLLIRGGGSIEDLWAFNDEGLARLIAKFPKPVISGVGHETDFTIADFVADLRAATPTASAVLAVPDWQLLLARLSGFQDLLASQQTAALDRAWQKLDQLNLRLRSPSEQLHARRQSLALPAMRMQRVMLHRIREANWQLARCRERFEQSKRPGFKTHRETLDGYEARLGQLAKQTLQSLRERVLGLERNLSLVNPRAVLQRGYSIVTRADGQVVRESRQVERGEELRVDLAVGHIQVTVGRVDRVNKVNRVNPKSGG